MKKIILFMSCAAMGILFPAWQMSEAEENPAEKQIKADSGLVGSRWILVYDNPKFGMREHDLIFNEGGKLINKSPHETSRENDTWEMSGNKVVLKFNNGFAIYTGDLIDSHHMEGTAISATGGKWKWKAERITTQETKPTE